MFPQNSNYVELKMYRNSLKQNKQPKNHYDRIIIINNRNICIYQNIF